MTPVRRAWNSPHSCGRFAAAGDILHRQPEGSLQARGQREDRASWEGERARSPRWRDTVTRSRPLAPSLLCCVNSVKPPGPVRTLPLLLRVTPGPLPCLGYLKQEHPHLPSQQCLSDRHTYHKAVGSMIAAQRRVFAVCSEQVAT